MRRLLATLAALAALAAAAGAGVIYSGVYDVSATEQHLASTFHLLEIGVRRSVLRRAEGIRVPPLDGEATIARGSALYAKHCVQCHGAPGLAPEPFALGLNPAPANLAYTARVWSPAEIFWTIENGIKMTGMPAWKFRLPEEDLWAIVAFVRVLPTFSPEQYQGRSGGAPAPARAPSHPTGAPDPERGKVALEQYACVTCHHIPGLVGPDAPVGPPLDGIGNRAFIAGLLPNEGDNMVRWLVAPQRINPRSAMPDLGVSEGDARDMAAYLARLK